MLQRAFIFVCLILVTLLSAVDIGDWQNIRFSGKTSANEVFVRLENETAAADQNKLLYYNGTSITEQSFSTLNALTGTMQAQYTPVGSNADLGLIVAGETKKINPVYFSGAGLPAPAQFTEASADTLNEQSTNYMDIVKDFFSFSATKFFAAIQNRGGGFPLGGTFGLPPFYSYMVIIANPADTSTVWAMNYMNVTLGGISPGLFRIQGTGTDGLVRIGDISTEIVSGSNLLKMSCNIADLLNDPAFAAWYNVNDPRFGIISMTQKTTLNGLTPVVQLMDISPGAKVYPKRLNNTLHPGVLPVLSNFSFHVTEADIWFQTTYQDSYGRFPLSISASWQDGQEFGLLPQSLEHSQPVIYRTANLTGDLEEYDDVLTFAKASLDNLDWAYSDSPTHSYAILLLPPQNISLNNAGGAWQLSWDPTVQSITDVSFTPDHFIVEYDSDPYFSAPVTASPVTGNSWQDADLDPARRFFRVRAFEQVP